MSKFIKRNTTVKIEIEDEAFEVDLAADEAAIAVGKAISEIAAMQKENTSDAETVFELMRQAYKEAINIILGEGATDQIFKEDNRLSYHDDVFIFLVNEIQRVGNEKLSKYSPERVQR